ncbi:MAG: hypothetical protein LUC43_08845, partial [Burkholderiales bacterium]|nr:hypothetical protein [Burkholderiales bacterium]
MVNALIALAMVLVETEESMIEFEVVISYLDTYCKMQIILSAVHTVNMKFQNSPLLNSTSTFEIQHHKIWHSVYT